METLQTWQKEIVSEDLINMKWWVGADWREMLSLIAIFWLGKKLMPTSCTCKNPIRLMGFVCLIHLTMLSKTQFK